MKPALFEQTSVREQFRDPMDAVASGKGVRDFTAIERRLDTQASLDRSAHAALARENKFIQRLLDDRDRQFAALQEEVAALKRDWAWRTLCLFRRGAIRLRRLFWRATAESSSIRRRSQPPAWRSTS
jgi:hypothetical protein